MFQLARPGHNSIRLNLQEVTMAEVIFINNLSQVEEGSRDNIRVTS